MNVFSTRLTTIALLGAFGSAWGQRPARSPLLKFMNATRMRRSVGCLVVISIACVFACTTARLELGASEAEGEMPTAARFDLTDPAVGPFPSDIFTVQDSTQNTGRRVNMPYPNCTVQVSECQDLDVINTLDGFGLQTQITIAFSGPIDPDTVTSNTVFVVDLGSTLPGDRPASGSVGINQTVWDVKTNTLYVEVDQLLDQHRRYGVIVTRDVHAANGSAIKMSSAFRDFLENGQPAWYRKDLLDALRAAHAIGVDPGHVAVASVYTTQTVTSVMERLRDDVLAGTPVPASFAIGPGGSRAVYNFSTITALRYRQQTTTTPSFTTATIELDQLTYVPGAIGTLAVGFYMSPSYLVPGEYIPSVATLAGKPAVQGQQAIYFVLYVPAGAKPNSGWPVAIVGHGGGGNHHANAAAVAAKLASHGIATIAIRGVGHGFGPLSQLAIDTNGTTVTLPDPGRGIDQNGNGVIANNEGSVAAGPRAWAIGERDGYRQTVIDLLQLVRVIQVGVDVDGDAVADLNANRIYYWGHSAGSMYGAIFAALEPDIHVVAFAVPGGMSPEHGRWAPGRRAGLGAMLAARTPSLVNGGITSIDGVAVNPPFYNENKPLRDQPPVSNTVDGAIAIQHAFELHEWGQQTGQSPIPWVRYLRATPLPGVGAKSLIMQFAKGDQQALNPGSSAILRVGDYVGRTLYYRHDLAFAQDPGVPANPHGFFFFPMHPNPTFRAVVRGGQDQVARFFESDGTITIHPDPANLFEVPIQGPLPETLSFVH
jgi:Bacterial Ig-like domain